MFVKGNSVKNKILFSDYPPQVSLQPGAYLNWKTQDGQPTISLPKCLSERVVRISGYVGHIRRIKESKNTATPLIAQVVLLAPYFTWAGDNASRADRIFVRTNCYSSNFVPRVRDGKVAYNVRLGDFVSGILQEVSSKNYNTANLVCWDFARLDEWNCYGALTVAGKSEIDLNEQHVGRLPLLNPLAILFLGTSVFYSSLFRSLIFVYKWDFLFLWFFNSGR